MCGSSQSKNKDPEDNYIDNPISKGGNEMDDEEYKFPGKVRASNEKIEPMTQKNKPKDSGGTLPSINKHKTEFTRDL